MGLRGCLSLRQNNGPFFNKNVENWGRKDGCQPLHAGYQTENILFFRIEKKVAKM